MGARGAAPRSPSRTGDPNARVPDPPSDLNRAHRLVFTKVIKDLIALGVYRVVDEELVARYCRALQFAAEYRRELEVLDRQRDEHSPMDFVKLKKHWVSLWKSCERDAMTYGKQLGLDPVTRGRLPDMPQEPETPAEKVGKGIGRAPSQLKVAG